MAHRRPAPPANGSRTGDAARAHHAATSSATPAPRAASRGCAAMSAATRRLEGSAPQAVMPATVALLDQPERRIQQRRMCTSLNGSSPAWRTSRPTPPVRTGARGRGSGRSSRRCRGPPGPRSRRCRPGAGRGPSRQSRAVVGDVLQQVGADHGVDAAVDDRQRACVGMQQPRRRQRACARAGRRDQVHADQARLRIGSRRSSSRYPLEQPMSAITAPGASGPIRSIIADRVHRSRKWVREDSSCRASSSSDQLTDGSCST